MEDNVKFGGLTDGLKGHVTVTKGVLMLEDIDYGFSWTGMQIKYILPRNGYLSGI